MVHEIAGTVERKGKKEVPSSSKGKGKGKEKVKGKGKGKAEASPEAKGPYKPNPDSKSPALLKKPKKKKKVSFSDCFSPPVIFVWSDASHCRLQNPSSCPTGHIPFSRLLRLRKQVEFIHSRSILNRALCRLKAKPVIPSSP